MWGAIHWLSFFVALLGRSWGFYVCLNVLWVHWLMFVRHHVRKTMSMSFVGRVEAWRTNRRKRFPQRNGRRPLAETMCRIQVVYLNRIGADISDCRVVTFILGIGLAKGETVEMTEFVSVPKWTCHSWGCHPTCSVRAACSILCENKKKYFCSIFCGLMWSLNPHMSKL